MSRRATVALEDAAEALGARNRAGAGFAVRLDDLVAEPLVRPLAVVVLDGAGDGAVRVHAPH